MGTVFRAEHLLTGQVVALKILPEDKWRNDEAAQQRFLREVRLSAAVEHENVVKVTDAGQDDTLHVLYIAMELLVGEDLESRLKQPTTRRKAIGWIREALSALVTAHAAGIVHRDLKPSNLFLAVGEDGVERVKLLDFGIARHPGVSDVTQEGVVVGTPHYMSPEQALRPAEVDHRADLWSVGVMLYEIVTGALPFEDESVHGLVMRAAFEPHAPLSSRAQGIDGRLSEVIDQCLAKEPDQRPDSADEVASVLDHVGGDESASWLDRRIGLSSDMPPTRSLDEVASVARASYRAASSDGSLSGSGDAEGRSAPPPVADSPRGGPSKGVRAMSRAPSLDVELEDGRPDTPRAPWTAIVFGLVGALVVGGWWLSMDTSEDAARETTPASPANAEDTELHGTTQPPTGGEPRPGSSRPGSSRSAAPGKATPTSRERVAASDGLKRDEDERAEAVTARRESPRSRTSRPRVTTTRPRRARRSESSRSSEDPVETVGAGPTDVEPANVGPSGAEGSSEFTDAPEELPGGVSDDAEEPGQAVDGPAEESPSAEPDQNEATDEEAPAADEPVDVPSSPPTADPSTPAEEAPPPAAESEPESGP